MKNEKYSVSTVNTWGQWLPLNSLEEYEKEKIENLCQMDLIAMAVLSQCKERNYHILTSLENLSYKVSLYMDEMGEEYNFPPLEKCSKEDIEALLYDISLRELDWEDTLLEDTL